MQHTYLQKEIMTVVTIVWWKGLLLANSVPKNSLCLMLQGGMLSESIREMRKLLRGISLASAEKSSVYCKYE
ncbi:hypothetical protein [Candidatus Nitrososphaera gargensis]|uniref:hypothetical protein n=1 Tax=Candidatus Nitrososphaera gargensis TaxID=497727 RepID=UPI0011E50C74|nr:hypothetical protein [Candidatus Nitrososphaera gargensis]